MLDGDGMMAVLPVSGGMYAQPSQDMRIYDVIRAKWNELRKEEFERMREAKK